MVPVYDDNVTRHEMPHYRFEEFRDSFRLSAPADDVVDGKPAWGYVFYSEIAFKFGDVESAFDEDISVYVRK